MPETAKHTAGYWNYSAFRSMGSLPGVDICSDTGANVAIVHYVEYDIERLECEANARLIAAAPMLLAALAEMVRLTDVPPKEFEQCAGKAVAQARAAIRAAGGAA